MKGQAYGTLNSWLWSFGDGPSTSTQQNPTHVYSLPGAYTVRLTAGAGVYTDTETKAGYVTWLCSSVTLSDPSASLRAGAKGLYAA